MPLVVKFPEQNEKEDVTRLASLTKFAPTVKQVVFEDRFDSALFVPDGPVVASTPGVDKRGKEYASTLDVDLKLYTNSMRAVYKQEGKIQKFVTWSGEAATVEIRGTVNHKLTSEGATTVNNAFEEIDSQGIRERTIDATPDEQVEDRLKELGYL